MMMGGDVDTIGAAGNSISQNQGANITGIKVDTKADHN